MRGGMNVVAVLAFLAVVLWILWSLREIFVIAM